MDWLILGVLIVGYLTTVRSAYRFAMKDGGEDPDNTDKALSVVLAFFVSLFWPAIWVGYLVYVLLLRGIKTDAQVELERQAREREQAQELDKLRALAKEYGLPGYKEM